MNKWFLRIFLASIIGLASSAIAMEAQEPEEKTSKYIPNYVPRGLLIFLDDSESEKGEIGFVSKALVKAISQDAGPIIASASVLHNAYSNELSINNTAYPNLSRWIIKRVNDYLYLLIPYNHLGKLDIDPQQTSIATQKEISNVELQLGLKVNHMKSETINIFSEPVAQLKKTADYFIEALENNTLFCTHTDYYKKNSAHPLWTIYMNGHGNFAKSIVYLELKDFKKVLEFFEHKIKTRLLVYVSCYAAGSNTEEIYKDSTSAVQRTYSFPIITHALTDAPVTKLGKIFASPENFHLFLSKVTQQEMPKYDEAIQDILMAKPGLGFNWNNLAQIKLPGMEWFSVMEQSKDIIAIGSILSKTRSPNSPLNITKFFRTKNPKAILLYAKNIPFELVIDPETSYKLEIIISMIPGPAIHTIKKISSSKLRPDEIISLFKKNKDIEPQKLFFIEEIASTSYPESLKNVVIYNEKRWNSPFPQFYYFYTKNNEFFANGQAIKALEKLQYDSLLEQISNQKKQLESSFIPQQPSPGKNIAVEKTEQKTTPTKIDHSPETPQKIARPADMATFEKKDYRTNDTHLHKAALHGRLDAVRYLVENQNAQVNVKNNFQQTPLHYAARQTENPEIVQYLINAGATIDEKDREEKTPLHIAAYNGSLEAVKYLLNAKANIKAKDIKGWTPLHSAAAMDQLATIQYLVNEAGADKNALDKASRTPAQLARDPKIISFLESKETPEKQSVTEKKEIVQEAPQKVARPDDINRFEFYYASPLHTAAQEGRLDVVRYLIEEKKYSVDKKNSDDETPLHKAAQGNHPEIVKHLVAAGAKVDVKDRNGNWPLHYAAEKGGLDIVRYFIEEKKCPVNAKNKNNTTPLHKAAANGHTKVVEYLAANGADVNSKETTGWTPLHFAVGLDYHIDTVKSLIKNGADVNAQNISEDTPLHVAARNNALEIIQYLVKYANANREIRNLDGKTPYDLAYTNDIKRLLRR